MYPYGYKKEHEDEKITVWYNYEEKKVNDISGLKWLINRRNPSIDSTTGL